MVSEASQNLGFSTISFLPQKADIAFKKLFDMGVTTVELLHEVPQRTSAKKITDIVDGNSSSLTVHGPFYDCNPASFVGTIRKNYIKRVKESIDFSEKIGAKILTLHPGHFPVFGEPIKKRAEKYYFDVLEEIVSYANKKISVAIENESKPPAHKSNCYPGPEEIKTVIDKFDGEIKMTLDIGHLNVTYSGDVNKILKYIQTLGKEIIQVHIHDNRGDKDSHLIPGEGSIDFGPILKCVKSNTENVDLILEIGNKGSVYDGNEEMLIKKSLNHMRRYI